jgi:NADPH2:quinone reductase
VIGTSGSRDEARSGCRRWAWTWRICTRSPDFQAQVLEATGGAGVDLVVNNVGGTVFAECVRCLAFEGRLATVGYVDGVLKRRSTCRRCMRSGWCCSACRRR